MHILRDFSIASLPYYQVEQWIECNFEGRVNPYRSELTGYQDLYEQE